MKNQRSGIEGGLGEDTMELAESIVFLVLPKESLSQLVRIQKKNLDIHKKMVFSPPIF